MNGSTFYLLFDYVIELKRDVKRIILFHGLSTKV